VSITTLGFCLISLFSVLATCTWYVCHSSPCKKDISRVTAEHNLQASTQKVMNHCVISQW